jgi:hypothetical protein
MYRDNAAETAISNPHLRLIFQRGVGDRMVVAMPYLCSPVSLSVKRSGRRLEMCFEKGPCAKYVEKEQREGR